jgi:hypothetical protein
MEGKWKAVVTIGNGDKRARPYWSSPPVASPKFLFER